GSRDTSFDVGGGLDSWGRVIKMLPNGQILLGGWFTSYHGQNHNRLVRINSDGTPDSNFNPFSGDSINPDGLFRQNVVVLNDDGSVDQSWAGRTNDKTESLLLQDDGKLILT